MLFKGTYIDASKEQKKPYDNMKYRNALYNVNIL